MVLEIYTPFVEKEEIITVDPQGRPIISFVKKEIEELFGDEVMIVNEEIYERKIPYSRQHLYLLEKTENHNGR